MKCLVVEDDISLRRDIVQAMSGMGYCCYAARSAKDASYHLKTKRFDVAVLDLATESSPVLLLAEYLHIFHAQTALIMITNPDAFPHGEGAQLVPNVDFFLRKPISMHELCAVVAYSTKQLR
jgi:DNA-binding response OmpR family regulator